MLTGQGSRKGRELLRRGNNSVARKVARIRDGRGRSTVAVIRGAVIGSPATKEAKEQVAKLPCLECL